MSISIGSNGDIGYYDSKNATSYHFKTSGDLIVKSETSESMKFDNQAQAIRYALENGKINDKNSLNFFQCLYEREIEKIEREKRENLKYTEQENNTQKAENERKIRKH